MANKKFNELGAVAYDAARIILTANPTTGALGKITNEAYIKGGLGYNVYTAFIAQSLTSAPTIAQQLQNTIGSSPTPTRDGAGEYLFTWPTNVFPTENKTLIHPFGNFSGTVSMIALSSGGSLDGYYLWFWNTVDSIKLLTYSPAFVLTDMSGLGITTMPLKIEVYP